MLDNRAAQDVWGKDRSTLVGLVALADRQSRTSRGRLSHQWTLAVFQRVPLLRLGAARWAHRAADGMPEWRMYLVPKSDYEIVDTWHTSGLRGTGSNDIVIKDAFVPAYRTQTVADNFHCRGPGQTVNNGPLYRLPFGQIFFRGISTPSVGALQGMLNTYLQYAGRRVSAMGKPSDDPVAQFVCAEAASALDEMKVILVRNFLRTRAYADKGETPPIQERMQYRFQSAEAAERASLLAVKLFRLTGGAGLFSEQPFGRMLADITAGRQHIGNQYQFHRSQLGRCVARRRAAA